MIQFSAFVPCCKSLTSSISPRLLRNYGDHGAQIRGMLESLSWSLGSEELFAHLKRRYPRICRWLWPCLCHWMSCTLSSCWRLSSKKELPLFRQTQQSNPALAVGKLRHSCDNKLPSDHHDFRCWPSPCKSLTLQHAREAPRASFQASNSRPALKKAAPYKPCGP